MWTEKSNWDDDTSTEYARKWRSWYFSDGKWRAVDDEIVEGLSREEMIVQYGGYTGAPMYTSSKQGKGTSRDIAVFSLDIRRFTDEEMAAYRAYDEKRGDLEWDEYLAFTDQWEKDHPDLEWLDRWGEVHPASYMVFIDYNADNGATIETHHIYCCTYPDLLEVLRLHT